MDRQKTARRIVSGYRHYEKVAETYSEIVSGLGDDVIENARGVNLTTIFANEEDHEYQFESSTGHSVDIEADAGVPPDELEKADLYISCSCPYWKYYGPEYHAQKNDYLRGSPRGTASKPDENDPDMDNFLCKHAYKALENLI